MLALKEIEDANGEIATIQSVSDDDSYVMVQVPKKGLVRIPVDLLTHREGKSYFLPISFNKLDQVVVSRGAHDDSAFDNREILRKIPVIEEQPVVRKRLIETGKVLIRKKVHEKEETVEQRLAKEEVEVERVPREEVRTTPAEIRYEGDTMIIPVQEEILVVEKRILVREELHVKRRRTERNEKVTVSLKSEEVSVERKKLN